MALCCAVVHARYAAFCSYVECFAFVFFFVLLHLQFKIPIIILNYNHTKNKILLFHLAFPFRNSRKTTTLLEMTARVTAAALDAGVAASLAAVGCYTDPRVNVENHLNKHKYMNPTTSTTKKNRTTENTW